MDNNPRAVALDRRGVIDVLDTGNPCVQVERL